MQRSSNNKGFTLVEILIVVIILGILAAIVIPQFSNASTDAKKNSLTSQLQTMRSQVELYKLQHNDKMPVKFQTDGTYGGATKESDWEGLTGQTDVSGNTGSAMVGNEKYGPYLQQIPVNPLNGETTIVVNGTANYTSLKDQAAPSAAGFVMNNLTGKIWATAASKTRIFNESEPSDTLNDSAN
jgi:general secretion pathway protein G